jgi:hypothetical protein
LGDASPQHEFTGVRLENQLTTHSDRRVSLLRQLGFELIENASRLGVEDDPMRRGSMIRILHEHMFAAKRARGCHSNVAPHHRPKAIIGWTCQWLAMCIVPRKDRRGDVVPVASPSQSRCAQPYGRARVAPPLGWSS